MRRKNKGITLVALVITIILLLILAGITIKSLTGTGLFEKTKEAKEKYENATKLENEILSQYEKQMTSGDPTVPKNPARNTTEAQEDYMLIKTVNSPIEDKNGNKITIPAGFKIKSDTDTNNAETVDKGIVIIDNTGNEFVWIPVPELVDKGDGTKEGRIYTKADKLEYKTVELNRYTFDDNGNPTAHNDAVIEVGGNNFQELQTSTYGNTTAKSITNFKNSVSVNKGYYIGRYEARISSNKNTIIQITEKGTDNVYNYVTQTQAAELAQKMYDNTKPFTSDLMNSYAWDTATLFLQRCGTNGKYSRQTPISSSLASTGTNNLTTKDVQCNVYDMASNIYEWTTETDSFSGSPCVNRGGNAYNGIGYTNHRSYCNNNGYVNIGFRPLLYL